MHGCRALLCSLTTALGGMCLLPGCEAIPISASPDRSTVSAKVIVAGKDVFVPGSDQFTAEGPSLVSRAVAILPPDTPLAISVFADSEHLPHHQPRGADIRLSVLRANRLGAYLQSKCGGCRTIRQTAGRGQGIADNRPPDRRIEIVSVME